MPVASTDLILKSTLDVEKRGLKFLFLTDLQAQAKTLVCDKHDLVGKDIHRTYI
jgi:hypothetical protein